MTEETLFERAVQLPTAERAAFLDRECAGHPELRGRVEALLAADAASHSPLDQPVAVPERTGEYTPHNEEPQPASRKTADSRPDSLAGTVIAGKYTLVEVIGEGGMGSVWRAKQTEPVKRFVAVKLIKAGMDSKSVLARFEAERQALALMDHPNIARVYDGGVVGQVSNLPLPLQDGQVGNLPHGGRPFFVMELVKGVPITDYCDANRLTPQQRLELFVQACQAIQHAHQKGIIHRDIKPSNVLVALYDDKPVVKVIDFGVAKATGGTLTEATIDTGIAGVVGTPQYMSPEQATFNNLDIDTRSDVYALGVLLYELLTGSPPFSGDELKKKGLLEILRVVREEEPPRPSTKLSTADALPSLSANRGTEPKKLTGMLRNELDWIVMKALEKDRTRRYETANGFAADVQRYLAGEPVLAYPPSRSYRVKKFVRRNRVQVVAASLVLIALLAGIAGTSWQAIRAEHARADAEAKEREANDERAKAVAAAERERLAKVAEEVRRKEAETNLGFAKKGNAILGSVFAGLDPKASYKSLAELRDALLVNLRKAVAEVDGSAVGDPLAVAEMQNTLGQSLFGLGETALAIAVFEKARATREARLGPDHPDTLATSHNLATCYRNAGRLDQAIPLLEQTIEREKVRHGPDQPETLTSMYTLALAYLDANRLDRAVPLLAETFRLRKSKLGPDHPHTLTSMGKLAFGYRAAGKLDLALPLFVETHERMTAVLGLDHPDTLAGMNLLALAYQDAGRLDRALPLSEEVVERQKATLGLDHPETLLSVNNLALCYQRTGQLDRARPLFEDTLKRQTARIGPDHPNTLMTANNLALGYLRVGQLDRARPLLEDTLKRRRVSLGPEHPDTINSLSSLAACLRLADKPDLALPLSEECLKLVQAKLPPNHAIALSTKNNLALVYQSLGKLELALPLFEDVLARWTAKVGPDHPETLNVMNNLAVVHSRLRRLDRSIPLFEEVVRRREKLLGRSHPATAGSIADLGVNYADLGRVVEALPLLEEAYRVSRKNPSLRWVGPALFDAYATAEKTAEAAKLVDELLADARKSAPSNSPQLAGVLAQFSQALLKLKRFAQVEPLLRESLTIREKAEPDAWTTFNTHSLLGGALLGQKKYADAEPLLVKGYEGLKSREKSIPPQAAIRVPEALDRLIELYTATNKPDEVKKYKELRAKYPAAKEVAPPPREKK